ncbi:putative bifunctional diguanylate cyclase/phosphodiesterase [Halothiobacillus sp. DCM-1]|uniref:putative bifunctional diguanylate cyclase/phosphodiesterase n=1 Tax=Halothiobacillus sp. DCM-1 TaxID=3112558 RepID=UPI003248A9A0
MSTPPIPPELSALLLDAMTDFVIAKDAGSHWLLANRAARELIGLDQLDWIGKTNFELAALSPPIMRAVLTSCQKTDEATWAALQPVRRTESIPDGQGGFVHFDIIKHPVFDAQGQPSHLLVIGRDVTAQHQAQERYEHTVSQDELTGLLNRRFFQIRAQQWLDELDPHSGRQLVLLLFDLDHFRAINDSYGHERGDQLLQEMARRLTHECGMERMLLGRLGGDEFAILVPGGDDPAELDYLGRRVQELAGRPFTFGQITLFTSASTGIVLWPDHGHTIGELLHQADSAMYAAKAQGRNGHAIFSPTLAEHQNWRAKLLTALRQGLTENRFHLVYQVQQNARSLAITGVEALLRWTPPTPDLVARPDQFVPLLEESGAIIELGGWILAEACSQLARWQTQVREPVTVAVNVSSIQLHAPCFLDRVRTALALSNINPACLELELTESALVADPIKAGQTLNALRALGVQLALDDFGTGYSSLSYLTKFSFNRLKIDKSFVQDILSDPSDLEIVKAIIAMGHALGLEVVAEGVETKAERDLLDALGCDSFQGYLVGRPSPATEIAPLLGVGLI